VLNFVIRHTGNGDIALLFLASALDARDQLHTPVTLFPEKGPLGTHWIRGWVGRRAGLDAVE
jgi:hypothetical protein